MLVDVAVSLMSYVFEKKKIYKLIWLIPQRFVYRPVDVYHFIPFIERQLEGRHKPETEQEEM